ncbi:MAG: malonyl-ACP O-methyltransferase BioC [Bacteroides sp.]|nr:malonyl-ACP O-methyltransferase BioC [Bacteroides sp.]
MTHNIQCIDKALVARRFAHSRSTYEREASVQRQVAEKMMRLLTETMQAEGVTPAELSARFRHVVELGCGTGSFSRILWSRLKPESLLLNDLCPEMEECVEALCTSPSVRFHPGDAEMLDFPGGTDLIASCSTLQWFNNPAAFFARCHCSLTTDGILAFSTFGAENMKQIRQLTGNGLNYLPLHRLEEMLAPHFHILHAEEEIVSLPFDNPIAVLKHLKQTGVTGTEKKVWTRGRLEAFCNEYIRRFGNEKGKVELTYHPIYLIVQKRK